MPKRKRELSEPRSTADLHGKASKFGQIIGELFARHVMDLVRTHLAAQHTDYILLEAEAGRSLLRLEMIGGTARQMDSVIAAKGSRDPVALLESKWLKDARHHNDKGAWILQLREVRKKYPTVRGAAAVLAGYWTEGVGVMFRSEGSVETAIVATDEEVYESLQAPVNEALQRLKLPDFVFDAREIRQRLPRPNDLMKALADVQVRDKLDPIAASWFRLPRVIEGKTISSGDLITRVIDRLIAPLPANPAIVSFEIALQVSTGNTIYCEFHDAEEAMAFIADFAHNPQAILDRITPKSNSKSGA